MEFTFIRDLTVFLLTRKLATFIRLPAQQKLFFILNFGLCGFAKTCILLFSYRTLSRYFGRSHQMTMASSLTTIQQHQRALFIRRGVRLAARYTPWDSSCLTQALVAKFWCDRWKIPYFLFIGLAKNSSKPLGKEAHAWVTAGRLAITGGYCFESHHVISTFSNV